MKLLYFFSIFLLICSCKKNEYEKNLTLAHKEYFSISENNQKLDSIKNIRKDSRETLEIHLDKKYNTNYHIGGIHFLIEDSITSYYLINYLENPILMCGNIDPLSKQDSINLINESVEKIKNIRPIKTREIINVLKKYKSKILSEKSNIPIQITFALKNDTLKGNSMYNILQYMEKNKMYIYDIRQMNNDELIKIQ